MQADKQRQKQEGIHKCKGKIQRQLEVQEQVFSAFAQCRKELLRHSLGIAEGLQIKGGNTARCFGNGGQGINIHHTEHEYAQHGADGNMNVFDFI